MQSNVLKNRTEKGGMTHLHSFGPFWNSDWVNGRIPWLKRHYGLTIVLHNELEVSLFLYQFVFSSFFCLNTLWKIVCNHLFEYQSKGAFIFRSSFFPSEKLKGRGDLEERLRFQVRTSRAVTSVGVTREWPKLAVIFYICALGIEPAFWKLFYCIEKRRVSFRNVSWTKNLKFANFLLF